MTTLDSLLVRIDASTELLRRELQKGGSAVDSFARNTDSRLGGMAGTFQKFGGQLRGALGALGIGFGAAAVVNFTKGAINAADAIGETARAAGFGAERFQRLSFVFRQNGVSAQEFDAAMRTLNTRLGQFINTGAGPAAKAIEQLGLKQRILGGEIRTSEQFFDAAITALDGVGNAAQRSALRAALFGREVGSKMAATLDQGVGAMNAAADAATGIFTDDTVSNASALADATARLGEATWNWAKGLAVAATYEVGKTFGVDEITALEATAERRLATLRERQRTLRAFGNKQLSPAEQTELDDLEAQIANRSRFRTGGTMEDAISGRKPPDDGLSEISGTLSAMPAELRRDFDFAAASAAVLNSELKEVSSGVVKMPDDLAKWTPAMNTFAASLRDSVSGVEKMRSEWDNVGKTLGMSLTDSLADAMLGIETNWKDMIKRMLAQAAISGLFTSLAGAPGALGKVFGFLGFGGARAEGGPVSAGKGYLVGERGPELFFPGQSGMIAANAGAGGPPINIHQYNTFHGGDPDEMSAAIAANNQRLKREIRAEIHHARSRGRP